MSDYFEQVESMHKGHAKEYTKLSKIPDIPFKTPEFAPDGIATIWQAMRDKTVQLANFHNEQATSLKTGILADLARMRNDLRKHLSDLDKEGVQGSKKVGKRMDKFVISCFLCGLIVIERSNAIFGEMDSCCRNKSYLSRRTS